ncbi:MAG: leucine--tRNA ligase [Patescibacteria group bacterium]|nr:leucine--tRNA ligase [Patescibacteria group bacterium]
MNYNPQKIEKKWQRRWEEKNIYSRPFRRKEKKNFYHLVMFPYSSGDLHIGHWYNFAPADVYARFKRMKGFNVISPMGFDAFGLPAENAAIKHRIHPKTWTYKNINRMRKQLKTMGAIYDWSREVITSDPSYYKWTQWMFLQLYKNGLAYRANVPCNFCPSCKTVLANEQVIDNKCERCGTEVEQKKIEQWLFKITDYTDDLLNGLKKLDWPEKTKTMQKNWIGKSEGWTIKFQILNSKFQLEVFTTRIDTLFGCTYLVVAPEHPIFKKLKSKISNIGPIEDYLEKSKKKTDRERISEIGQKTGVQIKGLMALNPVNQEKIPIFVADYVLIHYGKGAIMAVPAHDQRDFDFAKKHNLSIIEVIHPKSIVKSSVKKAPLLVSSELEHSAYDGEGFLINSDRFNGMRSLDARKRIGEWLERQNKAKKDVYYRLRDWLISRQRYWGCPIPMIYCQKCGWVPVPEKELPVVLPRIKNFKPTKEGRSPLANSKTFVNTTCPKCKGPAKRETDTMDTFVCSSWYYLRYIDPRNDKQFASKKKIDDWLPVNMYIGGAEHTVLHLLYSRFFTKALNDLKYINFKEPFLGLYHQGTILGLDGQKMSKSKGNVVSPDLFVQKYGADAVRMYLCFIGPYDRGGPWNPSGILGICRFLDKVYTLVETVKTKSQEETENSQDAKEINKLLNKTIQKVGDDIENFQFNTAISCLMILVNELSKNVRNKYSDIQTLLLLLAPFAPHLTEELWQKMGFSNLKDFKSANSIHNQLWPKYNPKLFKQSKIQLIVQINGKVRDRIEVKSSISKQDAEKLVLSRDIANKWIKNREVKKIIFIPKKLINIVY